MAYNAISFVAFEQPTTAKWNYIGTNDAGFKDGTNIDAGAITPAKLVTGTGSSWAMQSYTPTWTNFTVGNGTVTGRYIQIGKIVVGDVYVACGSTTAFGTNSAYSLPVTANSKYTSRRFSPIGQVTLHDNGSGVLWGLTNLDSSATTAYIEVGNTAATYTARTGTTATVPFTIANTDTIAIQFVYEAA